jgi:MFS family permease
MLFAEVVVCVAKVLTHHSGFIPDTILYLSYFYKNAELPRRLSWFWTSYQSTQVVGAFLAYGILHLSGGGLGEGWRYLFVSACSLC